MSAKLLSNLNGKNSILKKQILSLCINEDEYSIADLSKELNTSIPTITKIVGELIDEGFLEDRGKQGTNGGRRPSLYGLNPSIGYFAGVNISRHNISIVIVDFKGSIVDYSEEISFSIENSESSFIALCDRIKEAVQEAKIDIRKVMAYGVNLTGRVNHNTGYSFSFFLGETRPIAELISEYLGAPVYIENDSRAMTYGEYLAGAAKGEKNMLFINMTWGLGMGMILDGRLSYGKSGFSGEIGHFPLLDNNQICQCGKTGCLETGASGSALHRIVCEKLKSGKQSMLSESFAKKGDISLDEIINAILEEDVLAIECVEEIGTTLGRALAGLINLFNPELIVIGGELAAVKDYLLIPIKGAINKHSLKIVSKDTTLKFSKLGRKAGPIGACMLSRSKLLGLV